VNRNERHAAIQRLVREQPLSTQTELAEALRAEGHEVVQTTVSRDIHELGLIKVRHETGRLIYAFPEDTGAYSEELSEALKRWALTMESSGNLVVVVTPYGYASALAQAIDVARHPHIAGTVGGENTVLLISREPVTGAELASELQAQRLQGAA
jgi:transcriptional regulator of arginine metabolism